MFQIRIWIVSDTARDELTGDAGGKRSPPGVTPCMAYPTRPYRFLSSQPGSISQTHLFTIEVSEVVAIQFHPALLVDVGPETRRLYQGVPMSTWLPKAHEELDLPSLVNRPQRFSPGWPLGEGPRGRLAHPWGGFLSSHPALTTGDS